MHDHDRRDDGDRDGDGGAPRSQPVPGKRTRTAGLARTTGAAPRDARRGAAEPGPARAATASSAPRFDLGSIDDPLALHLYGVGDTVGAGHVYIRHGTGADPARAATASSAPPAAASSAPQASSTPHASGAPAVARATTSRDAGIAARIVVDRAGHVRARPDGPSLGVIALLDAATVLVSAIETVRGPLAPADEDAVAAAIAIMTGVAADLPPHESARLDDLASLAATYAERAAGAAPTAGAARSHAAPTGGAPPDRARTTDDATDPLRRLQLARDVLASRVALWGGLYHDRQPAALLREESAVMTTIVREAAAAVRALPKPSLHDAGPRGDAGAAAMVAAIGAEIDALYRIARGARSAQAAIGLDELFLAEDALFLAADLEAPQHRRRFYADRNAGDLAGRDPRDPAMPDGASLIDSIRAWFRSEATLKLLAVEGVETVLQEPERAADPPALERILAAAATAFLGALPGRLFEALAAAAVAGGDTLANVLRAVADPPIDRAMAPLVDAIEPAGGGAVRAGPLATAFLHRCRREVARYAGAVHQQLPALVHALELVPPAGLQAMLDGLTAAGPALHDALRRELLVQWMTVVHGATSGRDERGHSARGGSIAVATERPGAIRVALAIRDGAPGGGTGGAPEVHATRCTAGGVGAAVVAELRAAALPITAVAIDRFVDLAVIDPYTGAAIGLGSIYLAPDGTLDASGLDAPLELVRVAQELSDGGGPAPDDGPSLHTAMRRAAGTSRADVERAARLVLARAALTTAALD